jgi:hypothetical protein
MLGSGGRKGAVKIYAFVSKRVAQSSPPSHPQERFKAELASGGMGRAPV